MKAILRAPDGRPATEIPDLHVFAVHGRRGPVAVFLRIDQGGIWSETARDPGFRTRVESLGLLSRAAVPFVLNGTLPDPGVSLGVRLQATGGIAEPVMRVDGLDAAVLCDDYDQPIAVFGRSERDGIWAASAEDPDFHAKLEKAGVRPSGGRTEVVSLDQPAVGK